MNPAGTCGLYRTLSGSIGQAEFDSSRTLMLMNRGLMAGGSMQRIGRRRGFRGLVFLSMLLGSHDCQCVQQLCRKCNICNLCEHEMVLSTSNDANCLHTSCIQLSYCRLSWTLFRFSWILGHARFSKLLFQIEALFPHVSG